MASSAGRRSATNNSHGSKSSTLPDRVAQFYYSLGLFCSSYPFLIIFFVVFVILFCCYPLVNLPLPGNVPQEIFGPNLTSSSLSETKPWCYVQQIVLRTAVTPWSDELVLADAFRAPLYQVFQLLEIVRNYQHDPTKSLGHLCLHVEAVKQNKKEDLFLPEYTCLMLSPASFWQQNIQQFNQDSHLLTTIFNHENIQKGKISLAEILFGMNMKETGIKRYPLRNRQRVLQYAVTLIFKKFDERYVLGLKKKLESVYPLHQANQTAATTNNTLSTSDMLYIYYPGVVNYIEFLPLLVTLFSLFIYVYFSVRKMDLIHSKFGMAFAAVITVLCSLSMSIGLCFFFGLTLSLQGKKIFPYLVVLVGLENVLVLTKSVASTSQHLDVKIRISQGLSKEGWSITKNILVEITILTIGLATFVPVIQEFCIFAITGLISDFFLQMFFFSTILGLDIHRTETRTSYRNALYQTHTQLYERRTPLVAGIVRSKSHPRLTNLLNAQPQPIAANDQKKIPKRLRLVNIWARTRFFQRAFMIWMVVWISMIVYKSGIVQQFTTTNDFQHQKRNTPEFTVMKNFSSSPSSSTTIILNHSSFDMNDVTPKQISTDDLIKLRHSENSMPWLRLSTQHWPAIFDKYNISLGGRYIAILPTIKISRAVSPEQAILLRNGNEIHAPQTFKWHALAAALDPIDFNNDNGNQQPSGHFAQIDQPYYPNSPMEIFLATILGIISVIVVAYAMVVLYRCICTRNYAEWRASWSNEKTDEPITQLVMEAVPMVLDGHNQEIECLVSDGDNIVSTCLGGQLKIWDATTGEQMAHIDRKFYFGGTTSSVNSSPLDCDETILSDYESGSPPSRDENTHLLFPSLQRKINTNFSGCTLDTTNQFVNVASNRKSFDFDQYYRQLYISQDVITDHPNNKWIVNQNKSNITNPLSLNRRRVYSQSYDEKLLPGNTSTSTSIENFVHTPPPIWCIDYVDNLIALGCANGRLEFWEGTTGKLKCIFEDGLYTGVTSIKLVGNRVIVAKLNGSLDFLQLQTYNQGRQIDWGFTSAYRRTHIRTGSAGSLSDCNKPSYDMKTGNNEDIRCIRLHTVKAHQQPITAIDSEGGRVLSGSQDHTLKLYRFDDAVHMYTLHGHCGPITCLFIDRISPMTSGSGSQDGLLCVWDLVTGTCVYSTQAHDGSITSLTYSASYVISLGTDERLCVWERFQGHLLNTIQMNNTYAYDVLMLTHNLLVTSRQGSLVVLDVRTGETVRIVTLGHQDSCVFIKRTLLLRDTIVCDYGSQLRIVRFPLIAHKFE